MPHETGFECVFCNAPSFWNETSDACDECADGSHYDKLLKTCVVCPSWTPIEKDGKCLSCPENTFYSEEDELCIACAEGSKYDSEEKECIEIEEKIPVSAPKCPSNQIMNPDTKVCECPADKPNFTGFECVNC